MVTDALTRFLAEHAMEVDRTCEWPAAQLRLLANAGVFGLTIPEEFGGSADGNLVETYLLLSEHCLASTFILTQFHGACSRIAASENVQLKEELLPALAAGRQFATLGISHLTTSRQHVRTPAVQVWLRDDDMLLKGSIPWVTGAAHADVIVTGGTCEDGNQVLIALPTNVPGIRVQKSDSLLALTASHTAGVDLDNVSIPRDRLLGGPVPSVMQQFGGGAGGVTTSVLAAGVAGRAGKLIQQQAAQRAELRNTAEQFEREVNELVASLTLASREEADAPLSSNVLRQRATSLVLRITQAALAVSKGAGFVRGHPAELAAREAMFFLVWSCPQPVVLGVLEELACGEWV